MQRAFLEQYQTLPTIVTTSSHHNVGRTELLLHIARLRVLNESQPVQASDKEMSPAL